MDLLHDSLYELDQDEISVWKALRYRKGKDRAIPGREIARTTNIPYKRVQEIVSHLVCEHGKFIGSCTKGFYIPETQEELKDSTRVLKHRGILNFIRASKLEHISPYQLFQKSMLEYKKEMAL